MRKFPDDSLDQFRWHRLVKREPDRTRADLVRLQVSLECRAHCASHGIERPVLLPPCEVDDHSSVQLVSRNLIADRLLSARQRLADDAAHALQGGTRSGGLLCDIGVYRVGGWLLEPYYHFAGALIRSTAESRISRGLRLMRI